MAEEIWFYKLNMRVQQETATTVLYIFPINTILREPNRIEFNFIMMDYDTMRA